MEKEGYQLPEDIVSTGYKNMNNFQHEQVFYSKEKNFEGTAKEFAAAGLGYKYRQLNNSQRIVIN